jgi:Na+/H+ antiporter NhaD/arsenite permease-like protein
MRLNRPIFTFEAIVASFIAGVTALLVLSPILIVLRMICGRNWEYPAYVCVFIASVGMLYFRAHLIRRLLDGSDRSVRRDE